MTLTSAATSTEALEAEADAGNVDLVQTSVNAEVGFVMFNETRPPFDDPDARRAVALATDRDQYVQTISLGLFELASGAFPPGAPGFLADAGYPDFDLDAARALVADHEERTGRDFEFTYSHGTDEDSVRVAQFLQQQWEAAGMTVNLQSGEQAALINKALGTDWDIMGSRNFPGGFPDANYAWWHTGSPINFGRVSDPELDALMDEGRSELDPDVAVGIYEDANRRLNEGLHFGWLTWTEWTVATRPGVAGIFGAQLPDGTRFAGSVSTGHPTSGIYDSGVG